MILPFKYSLGVPQPSLSFPSFLFFHFHNFRKNLALCTNHFKVKLKNDYILDDFSYTLSLQQVINNRSVEQHLNEATSIVIYSPNNNRSSQQQTPASCAATYTISGNATTSTVTAPNGNDQGDSPLLSFCSVTNTLLNQ